MKALVSIIVPSYNHAQFLTQRLESIYNQTYTSFEVILLDDCSTDNSRDLLSAYKTHPNTSHVIFNEQNSGSAFSQWQRGIELASGKYIWVAESDDYCDLNFLETAVAKLELDFDLFYSQSVRIDADGREMTRNPYFWYNDLSPTRWRADFENDATLELQQFLFKKCVINNASAVVFRNEPRIKNYLKKVAGMYYAGDWLFWIQYLEQSRKICYSVATQNYFRTHGGVTRLRTPEKRNPEIVRIYKYVVRNPLASKMRSELAQYYFDTHIFKGSKRELGKNLALALRMCFASLRFVKPWFRYYFSSK
jgi:glycosyltransferase involved in cell wall biosynthesis